MILMFQRQDYVNDISIKGEKVHNVHEVVNALNHLPIWHQTKHRIKTRYKTI